MLKELKKKVQGEYPELNFYFEGIDDIDFRVYNSIEYAKCRRKFIGGVTAGVEIYILKTVIEIAHNTEEIEAICYHEIGHAVLQHGLILPRNPFYEECRADNYAVDNAGLHAMQAVLTRLIDLYPEKGWIKKRLTHLLDKKGV